MAALFIGWLGGRHKAAGAPESGPNVNSIE
jgi:hypothetical protein